jgi:hypothetical protein
LIIGSLIGNESQEIIQPLFSQVPYGEPSHLQGFYSPYYGSSHIAYRSSLRNFFQKLIQEYDLNRQQVDIKASMEVYAKLGNFIEISL